MSSRIHNAVGWSSNDCSDEIEAVNAIYGAETITVTESTDEAGLRRAILQVPGKPFSFTLTLPADYPGRPPHVDGTASSAKGAGAAAVSILQGVIGRVWQPGQVCLFDVIEEAGGLLRDENGQAEDTHEDAARSEPQIVQGDRRDDDTELASNLLSSPNWIISDSITEKKSVFVARCVPIVSKDDASNNMSHLLHTNKKVASATHNITAYRIKQEGASDVTIQDCDDDGESAADGRLLHLMQLMDVWNVLVVVTRWYGGVKLGPDRFRIINAVARHALVRGGFAKEKDDSKKRKGKK